MVPASGVVMILTVAVPVDEHNDATSVTVTVYVVVELGSAIGFIMFASLSEFAGVQL